jgi:hypothetical protein
MICFILSGFIITLFTVSKIQYDRLVSDMKPLKATIVDIDLDIHRKAPDEQEITIEYTVNGITYERKLETDTKVSFEAGRGAHYSVGDKVDIFYDPENPEVIAAPRSMVVGTFYFIVGLVMLTFVIFALSFVIKHRRKFLVTQEEYKKEKEDRKQKRLEKRKLRKKKNTKVRKVLLFVLIAILALIVAVICFYFLRGFVRGISG